MRVFFYMVDWDGNYDWTGFIPPEDRGTKNMGNTGTRYLGTGTGTVGLWHFNDQSGQTANDESSNNNDGQLGSTAGSDADDPSWVSTGRFGYALDFDGTDDLVGAGTTNFPSSTGSVEAWTPGLYCCVPPRPSEPARPPANCTIAWRSSVRMVCWNACEDSPTATRRGRSRRRNPASATPASWIRRKRASTGPNLPNCCSGACARSIPGRLPGA